MRQPKFQQTPNLNEQMNVSRPPLCCLPLTPRRSDYFFLFFSAAHASQRPKTGLALERRRGCVPSRFRLRRLRPDVPTRYTVRLVFYRYESEIFSHISTPAAGGVQAGRRADEGTSDKRRRSSDDGSTFGPRREQLCLILPLLAAQWSVISSTSRREESRIK